MSSGLEPIWAETLINMENPIHVKSNFEAGARRYHRGVPWRITAYEGASAFLADHTETNPVWFRVQPEKLFRVQETDISNYEADFYRRNS